MNEVMNMGKGNPYSFYVVLADGIMEIPQDSNCCCGNSNNQRRCMV